MSSENLLQNSSGPLENSISITSRSTRPIASSYTPLDSARRGRLYTLSIIASVTRQYFTELKEYKVIVCVECKYAV